MLRLNEFQIATPATIEEAVSLLAGRDDAILVAGGTDLVPKLKRGQMEPGLVVSLAAITELRGIGETGNGLRVGALTTLRELEHADSLGDFRSFREAARLVATPIIRTRATLGGNLLQDTRCRYYDRSEFWRGAVDYCMKKDGDVCRVAAGGTRCYATFCSDLAPALIVLDATAELAGPGPRTAPLESMYLDDGIEYADTRGRVLVGVTIRKRGYRSTYRKLRMRDSFDFPEVGVAVAMRGDANELSVNVAVVGVGSNVVVRKTTCAAADLDRLADDIVRDVRPMDTMYYPPAYRKKMAGRMLSSCFDELRTA